MNRLKRFFTAKTEVNALWYWILIGCALSGLTADLIDRFSR